MPRKSKAQETLDDLAGAWREHKRCDEAMREAETEEEAETARDVAIENWGKITGILDHLLEIH